MGVQLSAQPFTGAAGGLPFAAQLFFGAQPEWGFDVISQLVELPAAFASGPPDLVITGEGRFDRQTDQGKLISRLAKVCQTNQVPCIALVGQREESVSTAGWGAFTCLAISTGPMPLAEARQRTPQMLRETLRSVLKIYDFGRSAAT
jgi:glycerate kinase